MAKFSTTVSSSRRKARKAHFSADSESRRKLMAAPLSKELREKYGVRSMPIRTDDVVNVVRGAHGKKASPTEGKVILVQRKKFRVHIERLTRDKTNGTPVPVPLHPSNLVITKLKLDKDRLALLQRKKTGRDARKSEAASMARVD
ncbi:RPL26A [Symbiodinium sp. KB8]|nr:RPL26A [Symbiodinium sp. KB8]